MTVEDCEPYKLLRLRVTVEPDPCALPRLLGHFQQLNITPRKILAEFATTGLMHVQVDLCGLPEDRMSIIAAKIAEHVPVHGAYWHFL